MFSVLTTRSSSRYTRAWNGLNLILVESRLVPSFDPGERHQEGRDLCVQSRFLDLVSQRDFPKFWIDRRSEEALIKTR